MLILTQNDKIEIYTKNPCAYCQASKHYFTASNLRFVEYDLTGKFDEMNRLKMKTGHATFPQIFVNGTFIGGYDDLMKKLGKK